ncbi:hypothetical protein LINGRAHAP2_LOCUS30873 [Linum grandiflorum]
MEEEEVEQVGKRPFAGESCWGVSVRDRHGQSDELWLVKLPGKADVARVLNLGRWIFRERMIEEDCWFSFAGWSKVTAENGVVWVRMDGIPLHLYSTSLFKQLGNCCGKFLDFKEEGCSLNSVRIKVGQSRVIPSQISIFLEEVCFQIQVILEDRRCFDEGWRGRRSEVFVRVGIQASGSTKTSQTGRVAVGPSLVGKERGGVDEFKGDGQAMQVKEGTYVGVEMIGKRNDHDRRVEEESNRDEVKLIEEDVRKEDEVKLIEEVSLTDEGVLGGEEARKENGVRECSQIPMG